MFSRKSIFIVTGANRGLGKSIASNLASKAFKGSTIVLMARNLTCLKEAESEIRSQNSEINVVSAQFDQGSLDGIDTIFEKLLTSNKLDIQNFEQAVIVHNAGTLGDNSKFTKDLKDAEELTTYFNINLTGVMLLNASFLNHFKEDNFKHRYVINMSSLTAIKPFKSFSLYCTGKAARDMFFQVLAEEEPSVRVLSYAPGPCATDMLVQFRENTSDPDIKQTFQSMHEEGKILECDVSIKKLMKLLEEDKFVSGAHIDYFDVE